MLDDRIVKLSFKKALSDLFTAPPAGSGLNAFSVYGEAELRNTKHVPVFPYIYIIDSQVTFTVLQLPIVIVEFGDVRAYQFQIGDYRQRDYYSVMLNVLGRNRGEREDLASFVRKNLLTLEILDYNDPALTLLQTADVEVYGASPISVGQEMATEGTMNNWIVVSLSFAVDPWN